VIAILVGTNGASDGHSGALFLELVDASLSASPSLSRGCSATKSTSTSAHAALEMNGGRAGSKIWDEEDDFEDFEALVPALDELRRRLRG